MAVRFKKHIISYGDTIQSIAQKYFGDINLWVELAQFNNLRYPYIVDTNEEKLANPNHLKTVGDELLIKEANNSQSDLISELKRTSDFDQEEIYALALGKDLDILPLPQGFGSPGWDSETLELKATDTGKLATVRGIENLKQSLFIRLTTPKGSYLGHPEYGSNIHLYLGKKNTNENAKLLDIEIERTIRTDGRVTNVQMNEHVIKGNTYVASFNVYTLSMEDAFEFVIAANSDGIITLQDNFNELIL